MSVCLKMECCHLLSKSMPFWYLVSKTNPCAFSDYPYFEGFRGTWLWKYAKNIKNQKLFVKCSAWNDRLTEYKNLILLCNRDSAEQSFSFILFWDLWKFSSKTFPQTLFCVKNYEDSADLIIYSCSWNLENNCELL